LLGTTVRSAVSSRATGDPGAMDLEFGAPGPRAIFAGLDDAAAAWVRDGTAAALLGL
jgi:hypothetical protein